MTKVFLTILILFSSFSSSFSAPEIPNNVEKNPSISNIENIKMLLDKENQGKSLDENYSYEIEGAGVFIEPQAIQTSQINPDTGVPQQNMDYNLQSNIGYAFSKHFTAFLTYNLGDVSYDPSQKNIDLDINTSVINFNGVGSKINVSDDFGVKIMYFQRSNRSQDDLDIGKDHELQFKATVNF
jgi:hypothetical protein